MNVFLGITGASGAPYAARLLSALSESGAQVGVTISASGVGVLGTELHGDPAMPRDQVSARLTDGLAGVTVYDAKDFKSPYASGSAKVDGYVVRPCSMATAGTIAAGAMANLVHRAAFAIATARVLEGEALSVALTRTGCFPDLVIDRLSVGENTGNVVPSLKQIATAYQKLISNQLSMFTKVIASGVLMAVFTFVGFIAFAIVSAVFQVSASFKLGG